MTTHYQIAKKGLLLGLVMAAAQVVLAQPQNLPDLQTNAVSLLPPPTIPGAYPVNLPVNMVRTREAMAPYTDATAFDAAASDANGYKNIKEASQYLDGLGRPLQVILRQASTGNSPVDIVSPFRYDQYGREVEKYLPGASTENTGAFKSNPFAIYGNAGMMQTQYPGEVFFYNKTVYESSPLNRATKSYAAGNSWVGSDRPGTMEYMVNDAVDDVRKWDIISSTDFEVNIPVTPPINSAYDAGELMKTVVSDENGSFTVEYKDKNGRVILKKVQDGSLPVVYGYVGYMGWLNTYYVYDDLGRLRFVIPPKAVEWLTHHNWSFFTNNGSDGTTVVNELCFRYEYDERGRMIAKKIPGAGWTYMVYDAKDRLVHVQDANMQSRNQWLTTLYDDLNRPVMTGIFNYTGTRTDLQAMVSGSTPGSANIATSWDNRPASAPHIRINTNQAGTKTFSATTDIILEDGFSSADGADITLKILGIPAQNTVNENVVVDNNPLPPSTDFIALTITYYDDYSFTGNTYSTAINGQLDNTANDNPLSMPAISEVNTRGIITGTRVRTLSDINNLSAGTMLTNVNFYDNRNRLIQMQSENYAGGKDWVTNRYDFSGKIITTYLEHTDPQCVDISLQNIKVKTNITYDHGGRILEVYKTINDGAQKQLISKNTYDKLGQLQKKELNKNTNGSFLETLNYEYNIRGWLTGINKDYANGGNSAAWFGMSLNYDYGFTEGQFNGNISGTKWRSKGDGEQRAYGFGYDKANRLMYADFNQYTSSNWDKTAGVDFSVYMGDGVSVITAYDENGNIKQMKQYGLKLNASNPIDDLHYTYKENSNKLQNVIDRNNDEITKLGDFRTGANHPQKTAKANSTTDPLTITDYDYDNNGNLVKDLNKDIDASLVLQNGIEYNHLNLPWKIHIKNKGTITYIYDAAGNKLEKIIDEPAATPPAPVTKSVMYIGGFVYENNELQFFSHEEGRVREKDKVEDGVVTKDFVYDYFIKDHLGNIRTLLTAEEQTDNYPPASLEETIINTEKKYYTIPDDPAVRVNKNSVLGYPSDTETDPNNYIHKLQGNGTKMGTSIVLKVMAGDELNIKATSWYKLPLPGPNTNAPLGPTLVSALVNALSGAATAAGHGMPPTELENSNLLQPAVDAFLGNEDASVDLNKPRAYLNWILFDEHFKLVMSSSGFKQVSNVNQLEQLVKNNLAIDKSGYLYVYVSNESNEIPVYFDNLQVTHNRGHLLEESHYYPFGIIMRGISSKAAGVTENKIKYTSKEEQCNEFSDGSGLEWLDYGARMYDAQLGRWHVQDPHAYYYQNVTPYNYVMNNPLSYVDPTGKDYYFDHDGNYLGSDGNGDKLRLTQKSHWDAAQKSAKNDSKSKGLKGKDKTNAINSFVHTALTREDSEGNSFSREITIEGSEAVGVPVGQSTIDYLYQKSNEGAGGEYSVGIYLDVDNARIVLSPVAAGASVDPSTYTYSFPDLSNQQFKLIGNIHGHPDQKITRTDGGPGNSQDDRDLATSKGITVYSLERANKTDGQPSIYRSSSTGYGWNTEQYTGSRDVRSIKQDAIWQKIKPNDRK